MPKLNEKFVHNSQYFTDIQILTLIPSFGTEEFLDLEVHRCAVFGTCSSIARNSTDGDFLYVYLV